jgi:tetratricopeptide (TPR) repeat protein
MLNARYKAFISYSHQDDKWAAWLHRALESYKPPSKIVGQQTQFGAVPKRLSPIFRDREELPTATDLGAVITEALENSACQIILCSPAAARSHWVNEEIKAFKRLGRAERIFCLIVDGEPNATDMPGREHEECFPAALRYKLGPDGELSDERTEPIAADARAGKDGKNSAKLKLIAGMLGVGFDSLAQRELHRRQRRMFAIAAASIAGMVITTALAVSAMLARAEAVEQRARAEAEAETARQTTSFMVDLFSVSDPSEALGNTITAREILDRGAERIETELADQPEIQSTLMDTMGTVYTSLGLYEPAVSLLEKSLAKRTATFGEQNIEVADSKNNLGEVLTLKADFADAERYLTEALESRRAMLGPSDPAVADTLSNLAEVMTLGGRYEEAKPLIDEALVIRRDYYGSQPHADVARSLEDVGFNYYYLGDYDAAVSNLRDALEMSRAVHGDIHPDLAQATSNLAYMLYETGDYAQARTLFEDALTMLRRLLGPEHKDVASALINVAGVLHDSGEFALAEENYLEALQMQQKLLGPEHPDVINTMNNLAFLMYDDGRVTEAIDTMRDTLALTRRAYGDDHPEVGRIATNLGFWLIQQRSYDEARALLDEALAIRRAAFGDQHPQVASTLSIKANLLIEIEDFEDARETARQARMILTDDLSEDHWRVAMAESAEGAALTGLGDYAEAEMLLLHSDEVLRQAGAQQLLVDQNQARIQQLYSLWQN